MSDYVYMLESHLSPEQNRVVAEIQSAAGSAGVNLFLTGGAMRDMLAGRRVRDLDFVVEGNAPKVARAVAEAAAGSVAAEDEGRKSVELAFAGGVTAQIAMARQEKYGKAGGRPHISAATIQEDLRGRDFTCNAIALSLNRASRGLLLDPMNGLADIERRELRAVNAYGFYDDPSRLLRLTRFRVRLGFTIEERTRLQVANAREAGVEKSIPARVLCEELARIAVEDSPAEIAAALEEEGLLALFSPSLAGAKANLAGLSKLEKVFRLAPDDAHWLAGRFGPFVWALVEKLSPKERQAFIKNLQMTRAETDSWQKLEARVKKLETALRSARIHKPSQVYQLAAGAAPDEALFLLYHSTYKPVHERLRNFFQKYLPAAHEIPPEEWAALEGKPGTPKYIKARDAMIARNLDRKPRKPPEAEPQPEPPAPAEVPARRGR